MIKPIKKTEINEINPHNLLSLGNDFLDKYQTAGAIKISMFLTFNSEI